jgi:gliding motility-associated-like protein
MQGSWRWDFGDGFFVESLNPAFHTYGKDFLNARLAPSQDTSIEQGKIPVKLSFTDKNGCDTTITRDLTIKVAKIKVHNLLTPNDDTYNDKLKVYIEEEKEKDYREAYIETEFIVFDRWGKKVYHKVDYKSEEWDGERLSDGTYFYILNLTGQYTKDVIRGSITLMRPSR